MFSFGIVDSGVLLSADFEAEEPALLGVTLEYGWCVEVYSDGELSKVGWDANLTDTLDCRGTYAQAAIRSAIWAAYGEPEADGSGLYRLGWTVR